MRRKKTRYEKVRIALLFWTLFVGLGAVGGSLMMFCDPSGEAVGMDGLLPYFQVLPFADTLFENLLFSGICLLLINGVTNLLSAVLLLLGKKAGAVSAILFGLLLMAWCSLQFYLLPANALSIIYFLIGLIEAMTAFMCFVFQTQERFQKESNPLPTQIEGKKRLVVYFSRMGYAKEVAKEEKERNDADVLRLETSEKTNGTLGFWWCGRFAFEHLPMPLLPYDVDVSRYEKVIVVSPIWVFRVSPPIISFLTKEKGRIASLDYVFVHFMNASFKKEATRLDSLLSCSHKRLRSVRSRFGKRKDIC